LATTGVGFTTTVVESSSTSRPRRTERGWPVVEALLQLSAAERFRDRRLMLLLSLGAMMPWQEREPEILCSLAAWSISKRHSGWTKGDSEMLWSGLTLQRRRGESRRAMSENSDMRRTPW
jgi:hypothetical protein